ncbi:MAG: 50S ribosomal protein L18 [Bacteroidetes bacterium]|nr:50S ribosomal protein L18 [Bacteroidota bacterium]
MQFRKAKRNRRDRIKRKIRSKVFGTEARPRLSVYRSNSNIYAQIINDEKGLTIVSASDLKIKKGKKTERAQEVGKTLAELAKDKKITSVVFDRNGFNYAGRIKILADSAREAGLKF